MFKLSLCWNVFEGFKGLIICKKTLHYRIENQFIFLSIIFFLLKISTKFSIECTFHFSIFVFVFFFFALYFFFRYRSFVIVVLRQASFARRPSLYFNERYFWIPSMFDCSVHFARQIDLKKRYREAFFVKKNHLLL